MQKKIKKIVYLYKNVCINGFSTKQTAQKIKRPFTFFLPFFDWDGNDILLSTQNGAAIHRRIDNGLRSHFLQNASFPQTVSL